MTEKNNSNHTQDEVECSYTLPTLPSRTSAYGHSHTANTDSLDSDSEETPYAEEITPETDHSSEMVETRVTDRMQ